MYIIIHCIQYTLNDIKKKQNNLQYTKIDNLNAWENFHSFPKCLHCFFFIFSEMKQIQMQVFLAIFAHD